MHSQNARYTFSKKEKKYILQNHHHHNGLAACQHRLLPSSPVLPRNALLSACKRCAPDFHPLLPSLFGLIMPWIIGPSICDLTDCPPLNYPTYLSDARARQYTRVCSPPPLDRLGKLTQIGSLVTLQTLVLGLAFSSLL